VDDAEFFDSADKIRANLVGKLASTHWIPIRASHDFIADVLLRLDVFFGRLRLYRGYLTGFF
jgi:hypothetical protein